MKPKKTKKNQKKVKHKKHKNERKGWTNNQLFLFYFIFQEKLKLKYHSSFTTPEYKYHGFLYFNKHI